MNPRAEDPFEEGRSPPLRTRCTPFLLFLAVVLGLAAALRSEAPADESARGPSPEAHVPHISKPISVE